MSTKKPTGHIIYKGKSQLDGQPIVVIAITKSTNEKTGNMVQTYIMRDDVAPLEALKTGEDSSVCGDCKHRPILGGACYVNVGQGVRAVWAAYKKGNYPEASYWSHIGKGRMVRLGTYGDPAAVPAWVWEMLTVNALGITGYTHQWHNEALPVSELERLRTLCMASADTPEEKHKANSQGWRTFRIRLADEPLEHKEIACPASKEAGYKLTCAECKACNGTQTTRTANVAIVTHGAKSGRYIRLRSMA